MKLTNKQQQLVIDNLYLIKECNFNYYLRRSILTIDELFSAASLGLIEAVQKYVENLDIDPNNRRWELFAKKYINAYMLNEIKNNRLIRLPNYLLKKSYKETLKKRKENYYNNVKPTNKTGYYNNLLWLNMEHVNSSYKNYPHTLTKEDNSKEDDDLNLYEIINCFGFLNDKERQIVLLKLEGYTFQQIAELLGMTVWGCKVNYNKTVNKIKKII